MPQLFKKIHNKILIMAGTLGIGLGGYALQSNAQYQDASYSGSGSPSLIYKTILKNGLGAGGVKSGLAKISFTDSEAMENFYDMRGHVPLWTKGGDLARATEALRIFENSWTHGLNPSRYHTREIQALLENPILTDKARLELLVTDAAIRYGSDLTGMRFDPKLIKQKPEFWRMPLKPQEIIEKIAAGTDPVKGLKSLEPNTKLYRALQDELVRLSKEESDYDHVLPMTFGGDNHFTPGEKHKDVASLRVRLGVPYKKELGPENYYDDNTAAAMMKFQRAHGLEPDGIIGPQSLHVLNRTQKERMEQVIANLERLRWLDQEKPDRYLLVNIPQQLLWAVENGRVAHEMKVVVGMPWRRTKEFKTEVTGIRFNPNWTVPINLKMADFLPKLKEDPSYLSQKGIEVIKGYGSNAVTLDPLSIDWHKVGWKEMGEMRFVQTPGDHNALGAIRVLMPNEYNIYLHDTNHPEYFERGQRTYSSGCIRLSEPEKIADFVLRKNKDYSVAERKTLIEAGETVDVKAAGSFPIYIIYQSIWQDDKGRLVYGPDVYKRDRELIEVLSGLNGYRLPHEPDVRHADAGGVNAGTALAYNQ